MKYATIMINLKLKKRHVMIIDKMNIEDESSIIKAFQDCFLGGLALGLFHEMIGHVSSVAQGYMIYSSGPTAMAPLVFFANGFLGYATKIAVDTLGKKYNWKPSNIILITAAVETVIATALLVGAVFLGIMGPITAGVFIAVEVIARIRNFREFYNLKMEEVSQ